MWTLSFLCLVGLAYCAPIVDVDQRIHSEETDVLEQLAKDVIDSLPDDVKDAFKTFSAEDKDHIDEAVSHGKPGDSDAAMVYLRDHHPATYNKIATVINFVAAKLTRLGGESRKFLFDVYSKLKGVGIEYSKGRQFTVGEFKKMGLYFLTQFDALSPQAKGEFHVQFPVLVNFYNKYYQAIHEKLQPAPGDDQVPKFNDKNLIN